MFWLTTSPRADELCGMSLPDLSSYRGCPILLPAGVGVPPSANRDCSLVKSGNQAPLAMGTTIELEFPRALADVFSRCLSPSQADSLGPHDPARQSPAAHLQQLAGGGCTCPHPHLGSSETPSSPIPPHSPTRLFPHRFLSYYLPLRARGPAARSPSASGQELHHRRRGCLPHPPGDLRGLGAPVHAVRRSSSMTVETNLLLSQSGRGFTERNPSG
jgi:hypothetical protein